MEDGRTGISRFTMLALSNVIAVALMLAGALYFFWQDDVDRPVVRVAKVQADLTSAKNSILERMASEPVGLAPILTTEGTVVRSERKMVRLMPAPQVNAGSKQDALEITGAIASDSVTARAVTAKRITPDASYDLAYVTPGKPRLLDAVDPEEAKGAVSSGGKADRADRVRVASLAPELPVVSQKPQVADKFESAADKKKLQMLAKIKHKERERYCLSAAIYYESGYEPKSGKEAVAQVILNRKAHKDYPNTICGVVFHNDHMRNRCQFSFACDGKPERPKNNKAWSESVEVAADFLDKGKRMRSMRTATHYHADYVRPKWASQLDRISKIGAHIFYSVPKHKKRRYALKRSSNSRSYKRKGRRVFKVQASKPSLFASLFSNN